MNLEENDLNDHALPDDMLEIIAEAEKLVADAVDADTKATAARSAIQVAVQGIVDTAQVSVSKLYGYLKPGSPAPILAILWPQAKAPARAVAPSAPVQLEFAFEQVAEAVAAEPTFRVDAATTGETINNG